MKERCAAVSESPILTNAFFRRKVAWRAVVAICGMRWNWRLVLRSLACSGMSLWNWEAVGDRAGTGTSFVSSPASLVYRRVGDTEDEECRGGYFGEKPRRIADTRVRSLSFGVIMPVQSPRGPTTSKRGPSDLNQVCTESPTSYA